MSHAVSLPARLTAASFNREFSTLSLMAIAESEQGDAAFDDWILASSICGVVCGPERSRIKSCHSIAKLHELRQVNRMNFGT
ncbi:MAG: hypothetical protein IGR92_07660 [Leptolyngbyaceae cyanobacterium T60_A2020_046]|nr:hypothetical protein [Leptolyngbyaceae cyanobacterium T60_A2020_046]